MCRRWSDLLLGPPSRWESRELDFGLFARNRRPYLWQGAADWFAAHHGLLRRKGHLVQRFAVLHCCQIERYAAPSSWQLADLLHPLRPEVLRGLELQSTRSLPAPAIQALWRFTGGCCLLGAAREADGTKHPPFVKSPCAGLT